MEGLSGADILLPPHYPGHARRLENEKNSSIYKGLSSLRLVTDYHMGYPFRLAASPRLRRRPSPLRGTTSGTRSAGPGQLPTDGRASPMQMCYARPIHGNPIEHRNVDVIKSGGQARHCATGLRSTICERAITAEIFSMVW